MKRLLVLVLFASATLAQSPATKTWANSTDWQEGAFSVSYTGACDSTNTFPYSATGGNTDAACRQRICIGRNDNGVIANLTWAGTWETLGVPPGSIVSTVQMTDIATKMHAWNVCNSATLGPYALYTSADALVATLWTGRSPTAIEGSFTAEGSQSAQSVGSLTASDASIKLVLSMTTATGNNAAAERSATFDDFDISIAYSGASGAAKRRIIVTWDFSRGRFRVSN